MNANKYAVCALTKEQERLWAETRMALLWHAPGFTHLFLTMMNPEKTTHVAYFTKSVPIAATDGTSMLLNPDTFFKYDLLERVFICAHEICHCMLNHCVLIGQWKIAGKIKYPDGTSIRYHDGTMQIVLDHIINDMLVTGKIGKFNKDWIHNAAIISAKDSCTDAYRKVSHLIPPPPPPGQPGTPCKDGKPGKGQGNQPPQQGQQQPDPTQQPNSLTQKGKTFDQHLEPGEAQGQNPVEAMQDRNTARWQQEIAVAMSVEKMAGHADGFMQKMFKELLEPTIDWTDKLRTLISRKVGSDKNDFLHPHRRLMHYEIYAPSRTGKGCGTVAVGIDTSGSTIEDRDRFLAEVTGILQDLRPSEVILLWCDRRVHDVDRVYDPSEIETIRRRGAGGGGGTSFLPVFEWLEKNYVVPDCLIYLTDGVGPFPSRSPRYPCIWGSIYHQPKHYPFGEVVMIPKQAKKAAA